MWTTDTLKIFHPDGKPFLSYGEVIAEVENAKAKAKKAETEKAILAAKLKELGIDPSSLL